MSRSRFNTRSSSVHWCGLSGSLSVRQRIPQASPALPGSLSAGGIIGSLVGARVALGSNAARWIFWLLIGVLGYESIRLSFFYL